VQGYTGPTASIAVPSVLDQISSFLSNRTYNNASTFPPSYAQTLQRPLFILLAGANDILFNTNLTGAQSYAALMAGASQLLSSYTDGRLITIGIPNIGELPYGYYVNGTADKAALKTYSDSLADLLASGPSDPALRGKMTNVDLRKLFTKLDYYAEPESYGFGKLGKYGSCVVGEYFETSNVTVCGEGEVKERVYWDEYQ
jgi:hypothetical protein